MIRVSGHELTRGGQKIGSIQGDYIYSYEGHKLGSVQGTHVFDVSGNKLAWLEGDYIRTTSGKSIRIEDNHEHVNGGEISDIQRAAIRILLGD